MADEKLGELMMIFPDTEVDHLAKVLNDNQNDLEVVISVLLNSDGDVEDDVNVTEESKEELIIEGLHEQFQDFSIEEITKIYHETEKDENSTLMNLLNLKFLKEEHINSSAQKTIFEANLNQKPIETSSQKSQCWGQSLNEIEKIQKYTQAPSWLAQAAFFNKQTDVCKAIISIIADYESYKDNFSKALKKPKNKEEGQEEGEEGEEEEEKGEEEEERERDLKIKALVVGVQNLRSGRVQIGNRFQYLKNNVPDSTKDLPTQTSSTKKKLGPFSSNIKYTIENKNVIKLEDFLQNGSGMMRLIDHGFVVKTYEYFNGDIEKCKMVFLFLVERNAVKYTHVLQAKDVSRALQTNFKLAPVITCKPYVATTASTSGTQQRLNSVVNRYDGSSSTDITPGMFTSQEIYQRAKKYMDSIFSDYRADFHGFRPQEVMKILPLILNRWWAEEEFRKEMNNTKKEFTRALHVQHYTVVTGRGIHSINGKSKVRHVVKTYLEGSNYIFNEEPSFFEIIGLKHR